MATILCPIDFSESSDAAIDLAVSVATTRSAKLLLFHVDPPPTLAERFISADSYRRVQQDHRRWLESRLASARMRLHSETSVDAVSRISRGEPAEQIVAAAAALDVELIVMSTHSSRIRRAVLGSVAEAVARSAPCPVLLVRDHSDARVPFEKPLLCIDFSSLSEAAVRRAQQICRDDAELELLHVVNEPGIAALEVSLGKREEVLSLLDTLHRDARFRLEKFAASLPVGEASPRQTVLAGPIAATILGHAVDTKASLIVLGSHQPKGARQRILGTVADRVLHHATIPVLLCPP